jgi:hypothetical protein
MSLEDAALDRLNEYMSSFTTLHNSQKQQQALADSKSATGDSTSSGIEEYKIESLHDLKKSTGVLSSLQSMTKIGNDLLTLQQKSYPYRGHVGQNNSGSIEMESAILLYRRSLRNMKFTWGPLEKKKTIECKHTIYTSLSLYA